MTARAVDVKHEASGVRRNRVGDQDIAEGGVGDSENLNGPGGDGAVGGAQVDVDGGNSKGGAGGLGVKEVLYVPDPAGKEARSGVWLSPDVGFGTGLGVFAQVALVNRDFGLLSRGIAKAEQKGDEERGGFHADQTWRKGLRNASGIEKSCAKLRGRQRKSGYAAG
mgnify:CR=1 FL=1